MGIAPTGKEVTFRGIDVLRIAGGKVVERWSEYNALEAMQQMASSPLWRNSRPRASSLPGRDLGGRSGKGRFLAHE
jgi:hypothetical protein